MKPYLRIEDIWGLVQKYLKITLSDRDTFNLFCFLSLNFSFAIIELFYGIATNSLGLISDAFHMFFDCSALVTGLIASIISKWPRNPTYTFGYGRAEILAGLINALILVFISFFILKEAVERIFDQPHIHHHRLFLVSVLGFLVNVIGIFVFHHGHSSDSPCCHGGNHSHALDKNLHHDHTVNVETMYDNKTEHQHEHYHEHENCNDQFNDKDNNHENINVSDAHTNSDNYVAVPLPQLNNDNCCHENCHDGHGHGHEHLMLGEHKPKQNNQSKIIRGVFLHIMADTLGSVGVIISSFLITHYQMMISDTICSIFCSILIFMSALPLLKESIDILMERVPPHIEKEVFGAIDKIKRLPGIYGVPDYHAWTLCTNTYCSTVTVIIAPTVDPLILTENVKKILKKIGINEVCIQIERAY